MSWVADKIEHWPLARLLPYARNARTHSDDQVAQIAASIVEFGFTNPCLVGADGVLVAGHGRLLAARKLGLDTVPVVVLDHLTPIQRRALVIADNRIAENSGWDDAMLRTELESLQADGFDLDLTGFDPDTLAELLAGEETDQAGAVDGEQHVEVLHGDVVDQLVIGTLEEGGVDRHHRLGTFAGHASREGDGVLLGNRHVEVALGEALAERHQIRAFLHRRGDADQAVIGCGHVAQPLAEHVGVFRAAWLLRSGYRGTGSSLVMAW